MDRKEASNLIEAALNQSLQSNEDYEEGDLLMDWVVVAYTANPDEEKGGSYPVFYPNGTIPTYRARGLLRTALTMLEL